jgi:hypothetical protein
VVKQPAEDVVARVVKEVLEGLGALKESGFAFEAFDVRKGRAVI